MIAAFDNSFLALFFIANASPRPNPATGKPASDCHWRVQSLVNKLAEDGDQILIPAPVLAELATYLLLPYSSVSFEKVLAEIDNGRVFHIAPFDRLSAILLADATSKAVQVSDKRGGIDAPWQKVKFDRQVAAIAKAQDADILYTDDESQTRFAKNEFGLAVVHTWDLPLPQI